MVTAVGDWCEVWLILDGTVHEVRADRLPLEGGPRSDRLGWWNWTVAEHLAHRAAQAPAPPPTPVQTGLFEASMPA
ncbi:hypothetical protein [Streptomyces sp. NPDC088785]|uniref:hypothetical protein n=1 Tax=Streptomyces sp. NPDC088785 TaxID=3365897 RepID=UPI0038251101